VGRATRLLTFLVGMDKTYEGKLTFGAHAESTNGLCDTRRRQALASTCSRRH
jgi:tRNA U55 pseudouridine synthase TruB